MKQQLTFTTKTLKDALSFVGIAAAKKTYIPILENVLVAVGEGNVSLTGSNISSTLQTVVACKVEGIASGTEFVAPYLLLHNLLDKLSEDVVSLELVEAYGLIVRAGKGKYRLAGEASTDWPPTPQTSKEAFAITLEDEARTGFYEAISLVTFATDTKHTNPVFAGVSMELDETGFSFCGTNGHQLAMFAVPFQTSERAKVVLSTDFMQPLKRLLEATTEPLSLAIAGNRITATVGTTTVSGLMLQERFPDYKAAIPQDTPYTVALGKSELLGCLNRLALVSNADGATHLDFETGELTLSSEQVEIGNNGNESITCVWDYEPFTISLNARLLIAQLQHTEGETVNFALSASNRPVLITDLLTKYCGLLMPLNVTR